MTQMPYIGLVVHMESATCWNQIISMCVILVHDTLCSQSYGDSQLSMNRLRIMATQSPMLCTTRVDSGGCERGACQENDHRRPIPASASGRCIHSSMQACQCYEKTWWCSRSRRQRIQGRQVSYVLHPSFASTNLRVHVPLKVSLWYAATLFCSSSSLLQWCLASSEPLPTSMSSVSVCSNNTLKVVLTSCRYDYTMAAGW